MLVFSVCDDNPQFAKLLSDRIFKYCAYNLPDRAEPKLTPVFTAARSVLEYAEHSAIDVLFLDIDMPDVNGFELAARMQKDHPDTVIIFVSAYEDYVYSSFEYSPFRFLRKSHLDEELPTTLKKVVDKCLSDKESLDFHTTEGDEAVRVKDILYIEGQRNYYIVRTLHQRELKCRGTMESVEQAVSGFDFYRIHTAYIVNLDLIERVNSDGTVKMKDGGVITVSRRRLADFKKEYFNFIRRRITK
ncbi:MAG: response regulator transcription factor [Clostridia bacterium]|nr:response regulator transcription factor [Clostridia bacterium]